MEDKYKRQYINLGIGTAFAIAAFVIGKRVVRLIRERRSANSVNTNLEQINTKIISSGVNPTINDVTAKSIANAFLSAFDQMGTDNEVFDSNFSKISNAADWAKVRTAFGAVRYYGWGRTTSTWYGSELRLIGWCRKELSGERLLKCENIDAEADRLGLSLNGVASVNCVG